MWLLNVEMDASIRPSLLSVVTCAVYHLGVCSTPLVVIKAQPKNPQLRVGGHLGILCFSAIIFPHVWEPYGSCMHRTMLPVAMGAHINEII